MHSQDQPVMPSQRGTRILAVMAADVVDYTRLTEFAERETHTRLRALRVGTIDPCVVSYRGQVIKNTGDGFLASFDSSMDALRCALEIQREIPAQEASTPADRKIRLRIGLNVGEVITEMFKMMAGVQMQHVPYKGSGPMVIDLLAGQVQVAFDNLPASIEHIKAGRLRALAVTTAKRSERIPEVPTLAEFVPGYETSSWLAIGAPSKTPDEIVGVLNREINAGLADQKMNAKLADLGATVLPGSPVDTARLISDEIEKWRRVVIFSGLKPN